MPNRMAFALVLAMLLPAFSTAAFATSAQSFQSRISVTMTQSVEESGSTRTVSHAVTVTDLRGGLTQGTPSGEQIRVHFTSFLCDTPRTGIVVPPPRTGIVVSPTGTPSGCVPLLGSGALSISPAVFQQTRSFRASAIDPLLAAFPHLTARVILLDSNGTSLAYFSNAVAVPNIDISPSSPSPILWPEISWTKNTRPVTAGQSLTLEGKRLDEVISASIGTLPATISSSSAGTLTLRTPASLLPGTYDLVMQTRFGVITKINAVKIKSPTQPRILTFSSTAPHLNEQHAAALTAFRGSLSGEYEKVRCIVNSANPKAAQRIANLVCRQIARGELRHVEVDIETRGSFLGRGFWVRVYATG